MSAGRRVPSLLAVAMVLLAACSAGLRWDRADTTPEELKADIGACEREAAVAAEREAFGGRGGPTTAIIEIDRARGITRDANSTIRRAANQTEKARREELFRSCMLAKKYRPTQG